MYALLFAGTGLSTAQIASLFVIWSVTGFVLEVPSGMWADAFSRRWLLTIAPLLSGAGFALWTFAPAYPAFAAGFVLWGAGSALRSGTFQALAYEELDRLGAAASYARVIGRAEAVATGAQLLATLLAAPVLAAGGNTAAGVASVAVCLVGAAVGWSLPESRGAGEREGAGFAAVLREGVAEVRATPGVRGSLLLVAVLMGATALDEFVPLLAEATGAAPSVVPLLVLVVTAGFAVGGWLAGRGTRWAGPALMGGAGLLAVGAPVAVGEGWWGGTVAAGTEAAPWIGMVLIAAAFGVFQWAITAADARLQARIADRSRATITSMAGFGAEVVGVLAFAAYGLGSGLAGPGTLFALAAVPYAVVAVVLWRGR